MIARLWAAFVVLMIFNAAAGGLFWLLRIGYVRRRERGLKRV